MNYLETLKAALQRAGKLYPLARKLRVQLRRDKEKAKRNRRRLSRWQWIAASQRQGIVVAQDRWIARGHGDLRSHLVKFYPAHKHGHS